MSASAINDITKWRRSAHKCPACKRMLWVLPVTEGVVYFCGWGSCSSLAANDGAASIELLRKNVEEELADE